MDESSQATPAALSDDQQVDQPEALIAAIVEIEHYVGLSGWDQPARLFALVPTAELKLAEPQLADALTVTSPDALSSIEQDDFRDGDDLATTLGHIAWSDKVAGCALSLERTFLPAGFEGEAPEDPAEAIAFVNSHPQRQDIRIVVGVLRDGTKWGMGRLQKNQDGVLADPDLAPGLADALIGTFE